MPRGVYPRTAAQLAAAGQNLAKGHLPEVRAKANAAMRSLAKDPAWIQRVSAATATAMRRPEVRERHLRGLANAPVNFAGGNGQPLTAAVIEAARILEPLGFLREYTIPTRGHATKHLAPSAYKADFANPQTRVVVELDGPSHRPLATRATDAKKTEVLESLGWRVIRVRHGKEVSSHLAAVV